MGPALRTKAAASLGVVVLLLSGCVAFDPLPPRGFEVHNLTGERISVAPPAAPGATFYAESGELIHIMVAQKGCDSRSWVATSSSGTVLAQIASACMEYRWTIRGVDDSTYERYE